MEYVRYNLSKINYHNPLGSMYHTYQAIGKRGGYLSNRNTQAKTSIRYAPS